MQSPDRGIELDIGPFQIDLPQTLGYYGGLGAAVALGMVEPPLAAFIAAVPVAKILANSASPQPVRFVGQLLQGAGKPVGSDGEGTIRVTDPVRIRDAAVGVVGGALRTVQGLFTTPAPPALR